MPDKNGTLTPDEQQEAQDLYASLRQDKTFLTAHPEAHDLLASLVKDGTLKDLSAGAASSSPAPRPGAQAAFNSGTDAPDPSDPFAVPRLSRRPVQTADTVTATGSTPKGGSSLALPQSNLLQRAGAAIRAGQSPGQFLAEELSPVGSAIKQTLQSVGEGAIDPAAAIIASRLGRPQDAASYLAPVNAPTLSNPSGRPGGVGYDPTKNVVRAPYAFGRGIGEGVVPAGGGMVGAGAGAQAAEGILNLIPGANIDPRARVAAGLVGAGVGGLLGGQAVATAQNRLYDFLLTPEARKALTDQQALIQQQQPGAFEAGQIAAQIPYVKPNLSMTVNALKTRAASAGIAGGLSLAQQKLTNPGKPIDLTSTGRQMLGAALLSGGETPLGEALVGAGNGVARPLVRPTEALPEAALNRRIDQSLGSVDPALIAQEAAQQASLDAAAQERMSPNRGPRQIPVTRPGQISQAAPTMVRGVPVEVAARPAEVPAEPSPYDMTAEAGNTPTVVQSEHGNQKQGGGSPAQNVRASTRGTVPPLAGTNDVLAATLGQPEPGDSGGAAEGNAPNPEGVPAAKSGLTGQTSTVSIKSAADLRDAFIKHFGDTPETATAHAAIADAFRQVNGMTPEEYYGRFGVTRGGRNEKVVGEGLDQSSTGIADPQKILDYFDEEYGFHPNRAAEFTRDELGNGYFMSPEGGLTSPIEESAHAKAAFKALHSAGSDLGLGRPVEDWEIDDFLDQADRVHVDSVLRKTGMARVRTYRDSSDNPVLVVEHHGPPTPSQTRAVAKILAQNPEARLSYEIKDAKGNSLYGEDYEDYLKAARKATDAAHQASLNQGPNARIEFSASPASSARTVFRAFSTANASSALHELSHVARRDLWSAVEDKGDVNGITPLHLAEVERQYGVENGNWTRPAEEKFARAFERYVANGNAPTPVLSRVFEHLKGALATVYSAVRGTRRDPLPRTISPEVGHVFDRMLGKGMEISDPFAEAGQTPQVGEEGVQSTQDVERSRNEAATPADVSGVEKERTGEVLSRESPAQPETTTGGRAGVAADAATNAGANLAGMAPERAGSIGTRTLGVNDATRKEIVADAQAAGLGPRGEKVADIKQAAMSRPFGLESLKGVQPGVVPPSWTGRFSEYGERLSSETLAAKQAQQQARNFHDLQGTESSKAAYDKATEDYGTWLKHLSEFRNAWGQAGSVMSGKAEPLIGEAVGKSADEVILPKKGVKTPPVKSAEYGRGNKFSISSGDRAKIAADLREKLLAGGRDALNQESSSVTPEAAPDDTNTLNQGSVEATPLHDDLARLGAFHIEAGSRKPAQFREAMTADLGPKAAGKLTEGDWQAVFANARDYVEDKVKAAGGVGGSRTTFVEQLTPVLGKSGTADFVNTVTNLPNGTDIFDRFVTGGKDALTKDENDAVTNAYLETVSGVRAEQNKGAAQRRTGAMADLTAMAADVRAQQAKERMAARRQVRQEAAQQAKTPVTPEDQFTAALTRRYGSQKAAQAFLSSVGSDVAAKLVAEKTLTPEDRRAIVAAHKEAAAVRAAGTGKPAPQNVPAGTVASIVADARVSARESARQAREADILQKRADRQAEVSRKAAYAASPEGIFDRDLTRRYGQKGADAFKGALGEDIRQKLLAGTDLTDAERQSVADAHNAAVTAKTPGQASPSTPRGNAAAAVADIVATTKKAAQEAQRAQTAANQTPLDKYEVALRPRLGRDGAADFRKAVGEDVFGKVASGEDLTPEERAKIGDEYLSRLPQNAAKALSPNADANRVLQGAVRETRATLEKQRQASLSPAEQVREQILQMAPDQDKDPTSYSEFVSKMNDAVDGAENDPRRLSNVLSRYSATMGSNALAAYRSGLLSVPQTLGKIGMAHMLYMAAEEAKRAPAAAADIALSKITGNGRTVQGFSAPEVGRSLAKVGKEGLPTAGRILTQGDAAAKLASGHITPGERLPTEFSANRSGAVLNPLVRAPMRIHGAFYELMNTGAAERALGEVSNLEARRQIEEESPDLRGAAYKSAVEQRAASLRLNPTDDMLKFVTNAKNEATFTNENLATGAIKKAKQWAKKEAPDTTAVAETIGNIAVPFQRVPLNVASKAIEYSGAGVPIAAAKVLAAKIAGREITPQAQRIIANTFGRGVTGAAAMGLGYLIASGKLAPAFGKAGIAPPDEKEHEYGSLTDVGGRDYRIGQVQPIATPLFAGGYVAEAQRRRQGDTSGAPSIGDIAQGLGSASLSALRENPYLRLADTTGSLKEGGEALLKGDYKGVGKQAVRAGGSMLASALVPTILSQSAAQFDPEHSVRKKDSLLDYLANRLPLGQVGPVYGRYGLPVAVDKNGNPIPESAGILPFLPSVPAQERAR